MKKITGIMLAVAIFFSMMTVASFGADGKITLSSASSVAGGEVELTLSIMDNPGITSALFTVEYDKEKLTLKEVTDEGNLGTPNHSDDYSLAEYSLSWYNPLAEEDYTYNGNIATLTFEIAEGAAVGEYPITLSVKEAYNAKMQPVTLLSENGEITVYANESFEGITFSDKSFVYDGTEKSLEIEGVLPEGAEVSYENNGATDVSETTVTAVITKEGYDDLTLTATLEITPKDLSVTGIELMEKIYDGTTAVGFTGGTLKGAIEGDSVSLSLGETGNFETPDVGKNKTVTLSATLSGDDKNNYTLTMPSLSGEIEKKEISVRTLNLDDETVTFAGIVEEDAENVTINFTMIEITLGDDASAGRTAVDVSGILLTGSKSGNYTLDSGRFSTSISNSKTTLVTVDVERGGSVTGAGRYLKGDTVTLKATAKSGYKFVRWEMEGESVSYTRTYTCTAGEDFTIKANFKKSSTSGGGSIVTDDDKVVIGGGTTVTPTPVTPVTPTPVTPAPVQPSEQPSELTAPKERKPEKEIVLTIGQKEAVVFGEKKTNDVSAIIKNSRTMLPIRFISEALAATVSWDGEKREVKVTKDGVEIVISIDSSQAMVNGKAVALDSPAFIENSRTYLPVRFISETLGADVYWEDATKSVIIQVK